MESEIGYDDRLQFQMIAGDDESYQDIEKMKDFPEFGDDFAKVDVTHHTSPGRRREYVAGMADAAELNYQAIWVRGETQEAVRAAVGTVRNFRHIYKTEPELQITFPALILAAKPTSPTEEARMLAIKLQPTGDFQEEDLT